MTTRAANRFSVKTDASVFKRLGRGNQENFTRYHQVNGPVCKYWLEGRCTRNPCRFWHPDLAKPDTFKSDYAWKNPNTLKSEISPPIEKPQRTFVKNQNQLSENSPPIEKAQPNILKNRNQWSENSPPIEKAQINVLKNRNQSVPETEQKSEYLLPIEKAQRKVLKNEENFEQKLSTIEVNVDQSINIQKKHKLCKQWMTKNCAKGDKCENLHSWFCGNGLSMVAQLEGHTKAVTGIVLPSGSNKLYCGSNDKSLRVWDCNNGQCGTIVDLNDECGILVYEGPWIFVGLRNMIKGWNLNTQGEVILRGSGGQVNAIAMFEDILFAGMEDGTILSWESTETATSLKGHTGSVVSLVVGAKKLFSGSSDHTIRVWNAESLECMHVLRGHTSDVTTLLCWDQYLLSGSLDKKIEVWGTTESGGIEKVYERDVDDGVLAFCGMHDSEAKPILLCSSKHNGVCLYDLPLFEERGRVFSRRDVQAIQVGPDGLFFTGDAEGLISVWKLN